MLRVKVAAAPGTGVASDPRRLEQAALPRATATTTTEIVCRARTKAV
jgi:hypothetical protein